MSGYGDFAEAYDALTFNVPYDEIAEYYNKVICKSAGDPKGKRLLDMGCGTGNLTIRLAKLGYDVIGQDASEEMLSIAAGKSSKIRWICQNMEETELGIPADVIVSTLDSINHLSSRSDIARCFRCAFENLKSGGVFVFDVNTIFKHREILSRNTFVYDVDGVYCVWQNSFDETDNGVDIELDLFFEEGELYSRGSESFREIALPEEDYRKLLEEAGFEIANIWEYLTFDKPTDSSEKLLISAKKP